MKIAYIFKNEENRSSGVRKKVIEISNAINKKGHDAYIFFVRKFGLKSAFESLFFVARSDFDLYIIRHTPIFVITLAPAIIFKRMKGAKFILEVPTPVTQNIREISKSDGTIWLNALKINHLILFTPLNNIFFNRIIQYAPESYYFSLFARKKTLLTSNGIDTASVPKPLAKTQSVALRLVAVAAIEYWHGYDRLIRSLHHTIKKNKNFKNLVHLTIIGDGPARSVLMSLTQELDLQEHVRFTGAIQSDKLTTYFQDADMGVCGLGLHRKNLSFSSQLKVREYLAHGLPIIHAGADPDLEQSLDFVFRVSNDEEIIDLDAIYKRHAVLRDKDPNLHLRIRRFAEDQLDFSKKIEEQYLNV